MRKKLWHGVHKRRLRGVWAAGLCGALLLSACGGASGEPTAATTPGAGATSAPAPTTATEPTVTAALWSADAPVTTIMEKLQLAGEPYAVEGDPNAPITIVEFSDYG